jgi:hypothetical protein
LSFAMGFSNFTKIACVYIGRLELALVNAFLQDGSPAYAIPLSAMVSLRGADYMKEIQKATHEAYKTGISDRRIICVKFRYEPRPADTYAWFRRGSRDAGVNEEQRKNSGLSVEDDEANAGEEGWSGDTVVFVLHMLDDHGTLLTHRVGSILTAA